MISKVVITLKGKTVKVCYSPRYCKDDKLLIATEWEGKRANQSKSGDLPVNRRYIFRRGRI